MDKEKMLKKLSKINFRNKEELESGRLENKIFNIFNKEYKRLLETNKKTNQKLNIYFSEEDLQELLNGEEFNWTFTTDKGEDINIHLYKGEEEE